MADLELVVIAGPDLGLRVAVAGPLLVGRGHDAGLQLTDRRVSRRHLEVAPDGTGLTIAVVGDASSITVDGEETRQARVGPNARIVIGDSAIRVSAGAPDATGEVTDVRTLLGDTAIEARGLPAVFALSESLGRVEALSDLDAAVAQWAEEHLGGEAVLEDEPAAVDRLVESDATPGGVKVIASLGAGEGRLAVTLSRMRRPLGDDVRRLLAVAATLIGASRLRLRRLRASRADADALRRIAVGSASSFLGRSGEAARVAALIPKLARSPSTVLITGETGVGKTFLARLIHEASSRARSPFRVVNCAALPEHLVESELFGHERGAFTGAIQARTGVLEDAGEGTVLLDEIGDLPMAVQAKLLSVLEDGRFTRLGSNRVTALRARIVAATHHDLPALVRAGRFRSDLFFRVSVVEVEVAPLRDRRDDIALLARRFLADLAATAGRSIEDISDAAIERLVAYTWPGNVRELRNVVEHAVVLGDDPVVKPGDLPPHVTGTTGPTVESDRDTVILPCDLASLERRAIEAAVRATEGNRTKAASLLGINRATLYKKLKAWQDDEAERRRSQRRSRHAGPSKP